MDSTTLIMTYYLVHKIELISDAVTYTPIGYVNDLSDCDVVNSNYDSTLGSWVDVNKTSLESGATTMSDFFDSTPLVLIARTEVTSIDGYSFVDVNSL